jgi:hypothetical protein
MINQRFGQGVSKLSTVAELRTFDGIDHQKNQNRVKVAAFLLRRRHEDDINTNSLLYKKISE